MALKLLTQKTILSSRLSPSQRYLLRFSKSYVLLMLLCIILGGSGALFNGVSTALVVPIVLNLVGQDITLKQAPPILRIFMHPFDGLQGDFRLASMALCLFLAIFLKNLLTYCSVLATNYLGRTIASDMREDGLKLLLNIDLDFFVKNKVGDLLNRMSTEIQRACQVLMLWIELTTVVATISVFILLLISLSWQLTLLTTILLSFILLLNRLSIKKSRKFGKELSRLSTAMNVRLLEMMSGIRLVKATANEEREYKNISNIIRGREKAEFLNAAIIGATGPITEVASIGVLLIVIFVSRFLFANMLSSYATIMLTYFVILFRILPFISRLNSMRTHLANISPSLDITYDFLRMDNKPKMTSGSIPFTGLQREIHFNQISFSYPKHTDIVLNSIDLRIPKGKTLALVGSSGSGKSTLADLLPRFYDPTSGSIILDGIDLREFDLRSLRYAMGIVGQDTFLFNDSIFNNIAYGRPSSSQEEVMTAAKRANAYEFIDSLPEKFDTLIGDRGVLLSGGQRQRISIARALLQDPEILILDEATSALDTVSEQLVQSAIEDLSKDRTTLVIAHRLSTIQRAHQIAVMEKGRVIELGNHEELLAHKGVYHRLYTMQFSKQKVDHQKNLVDAQNLFSHRVRTQLNSLIGSLQLLSDEMIDMPEEEHELIDMSFTSAIDLISILEKYEQMSISE